MQPGFADRVSIPFGLAARPLAWQLIGRQGWWARLLAGIGVQIGLTVEHLRTSDDNATTAGLHAAFGIDVPLYGGPSRAASRCACTDASSSRPRLPSTRTRSSSRRRRGSSWPASPTIRERASAGKSERGRRGPRSERLVGEPLQDDAVTESAELEIWNHRLAQVAEEMGVALARAAFSPNIKERRDYSCALFDPAGRLVAQAAHIPVHLGSTALSVRAVLERLTLADGEIAIVNDPYAGGTHLPDITLVRAGVHTRTARRLCGESRPSRRRRWQRAGIDAGRRPRASATRCPRPKSCRRRCRRATAPGPAVR